MIVTLDGPAGAGKSTAARGLAKRLGFRFIDTGAMYRAVALAAVNAGHDWNDANALPQLAKRVKIELPGDRVLLDGADVTTEIRRSQITTVTHYAANTPGVREHLVELQRQLAVGANVVTEGRDQGTVVFPEAECKFFLTANPEERARRRQLDLQARGENESLEAVLHQQNQRDQSDTSRSVGPLAPAADAIHFSTDGLSQEEVIDRLEAIVLERMQKGEGGRRKAE
jgi:CMP/dCMP kinase